MRSLVAALVVLSTLASCDTPSADHGSGSGELLYEGEPAAVWLRRIEDLSDQVGWKAQAALVRFGPDVAGDLVPMLAHDRAEVASRVHEALHDMEGAARPALEHGLVHPDRRVRLRAAALLIEARTGIVVNAWALLESEQSREPPGGASRTLAETPVEERVATAAVLALVGTGGAEAEAVLVAGLDSDPDRVLAAWSLASAGRLVERSVALLAGLVDPDEWWLCQDAVRCLGDLGPLARPAIPALERYAAEVAPTVPRDWAMEALARIRVE